MKANDQAIEAALAERDTYKNWLDNYEKQFAAKVEELVTVRLERDALLARLAPLDDEALVEIATREIFIDRSNQEREMNQTIDVVEWLQERAFRMCGPTMEAAHTKTKEWLWADEITRLRADLAAVTAERDAAKRSAYEDAARFIEENIFNYSSGDQNYWSHRKGDNTHGLEYAREFRKKAAAIRSGK